MNVKRKEAAVKKFAPLFEKGLTLEELTDMIGKDEKEYTTDEATEIAAAITGGVTDSTNVSKPVGQKKKAVEAVGYQEWRCEIKVEDGKRRAEKVKLLRPCVKITDDEAETLNNGALNSPRQDYVLMYFKPE